MPGSLFSLYEKWPSDQLWLPGRFFAVSTITGLFTKENHHSQMIFSYDVV